MKNICGPTLSRGLLAWLAFFDRREFHHQLERCGRVFLCRYSCEIWEGVFVELNNRERGECITFTFDDVYTSEVCVTHSFTLPNYCWRLYLSLNTVYLYSQHTPPIRYAKPIRFVNGVLYAADNKFLMPTKIVAGQTGQRVILRRRATAQARSGVESVRQTLSGLRPFLKTQNCDQQQQQQQHQHPSPLPFPFPFPLRAASLPYSPSLSPSVYPRYYHHHHHHPSPHQARSLITAVCTDASIYPFGSGNSFISRHRYHQRKPDSFHLNVYPQTRHLRRPADEHHYSHHHQHPALQQQQQQQPEHTHPPSSHPSSPPMLFSRKAILTKGKKPLYAASRVINASSAQASSVFARCWVHSTNKTSALFRSVRGVSLRRAYATNRTVGTGGGGGVGSSVGAVSGASVGASASASAAAAAAAAESAGSAATGIPASAMVKGMPFYR